MTDQEIISAVSSKMLKELEEYRERLLISSPEYIYLQSHKTAILTEIYRCVCDCDFLSINQEQLYLRLLEEPNVLECLYDEYLSTDVANIRFEVERLFYISR